MEHWPEKTCAKEVGEDKPSSDPVFAPLDQVLTAGGDARLHLDPATLLNGYGCRPFPRPEAYTFASSTATSISDRGYRAAGAMHQALMDAAAKSSLHDAFDREAEQLRSGVMRLLELQGTGHALVFSASGTDSELHAVFVALATLGAPVASVIAASDETGSGTTFAAVGRHFSSVTSLGVAVAKGDPIDGIAEHTTSHLIPLRTADGTLRAMSEIDRDVIRATSQAIASGNRVLLHAMDHSKLGWHSPSLDCVREVATRWRGRVQVVIDACQMRISRGRLRCYLDDGYVVQATGSKFFTGPPFSGALFVPAPLAARMAEVAQVPVGLRAYTSRSDWPAEWGAIRQSLGDTMNIGQLLRWVSAEEEMHWYFAVPAQYRNAALTQFTSAAHALIEGQDNLQLLPECPDATWSTADNDELAVRTIFPFFIRRDGDVMPVADCTIVYRALNRDLAALLPAGASRAERVLASQSCHIGQPVAVPQPSGAIAGALRISAGARILSETWSNEGHDRAFAKLAGEIAQVRTILDKIQLILRHFERFQGAFRN